MRPCRLLRLVAVAACQPPRRERSASGDPELRARRGLVLGLHDGAASRGAGPGSASPSPARPARARTSRARARRLGAAAALIAQATSQTAALGTEPILPIGRE